MTFNVLKHSFLISLLALVLGCGAYSFTGISLSAETKTFQVNYFQNTSALIEPGIERDFTLALQDLILNQTNLDLVKSKGDILYEGEIIDYRDSWIWVGANNSLDSCAVEHRGFLYGDISYISIFDEALTSQQTSDLFSMKNQKILDVETVSKNTAAVYTFNDDEMTPYKVYDISNNGNHMVLFDNKWMAKNF